MKKIFNFVLIALFCLILFGCSATYTIRTKDGKEYISQGTPDLTGDKFIKFETTGGRKVLIKQDEISSIQEN
jgi:hypothetical protein